MNTKASGILSGNHSRLGRDIETHNHDGINSVELDGSGGSLIDRGTELFYDFNQTDLTLDDTTREINLSAIVPNGTIWVLLSVKYKGGTVEDYLTFMSADYDSKNSRLLYIMVDDKYACDDVWIPVSSGKIGYKIPNTVTNVYLIVRAYI